MCLSHRLAERLAESRFGGPGAEPHYAPDLALEPEHYAIDVTLDLKAETAKLALVHTIKCNTAGARQLRLDGIDFLDLKVTGLAGQDVTSSYDGRHIDITWKNGFAKGETRQVSLTYRVEKPATGLFFMQPTKAAPNKGLYAATDHETERARYWLACIDFPNVRTHLDIKLTADAKLTALANGTMMGETANKDGTKTTHWQLKERCPSYLICFAVGDFVRCDDGKHGDIQLSYFTTKDFTADDLKRAFGRTGQMLSWMEKRLGVPFPYPKYYQFALPYFSGAMENISLVSWTDWFVLDERAAKERTWVTDQVNVHEMAHSYFGDLIGCRDFSHVWLKESWATYMETCWLEDQRGKDEQFYDLYRNAQAYFKEADESYARPMVTRRYTSSWQMFDRHLYPGGACRLHTLRQEVGDAGFWAGVTDYISTYRNRAVETEDFRKMLEKHSGRTLTKYFDQWFYTAAYPHLKVSFKYDDEKKLGTFTVEQKQAKKTKDAEILPFDLSTDLGWTIDGKDELMAIKLTDAKQSFTVPMAKDPDQVRFDPQWKILHKLEFEPGEGKLLKQLTGAKDVLGRIHAAHVLAGSGKRSHVKALLDAYRKEPFWGVRCEIAEALADAGTADALATLATIVAEEKDHLVLPGVMQAAGRFRDAGLAAAVEARLKVGDLGYDATSSAYQALGAQGEAAPAAVLRAGATKNEPRYGTEQAAALTALGRTRQRDAAEYLQKQVTPGALPYRARSGAVAGLAASALHLDRPQREAIEDRLIDLLRDEEPWVRMAAAKALGRTETRRALGALGAYASTLPLQERVTVDDIMRGLSKDAPTKVSALEKQLEELTEKLRKLESKVQDLSEKRSSS
jgi:aminopeptidase N